MVPIIKKFKITSNCKLNLSIPIYLDEIQKRKSPTKSPLSCLARGKHPFNFPITGCNIRYANSGNNEAPLEKKL